jgi:hypothetical protein
MPLKKEFAMLKALLEKLKEAAVSIGPVALLVLFISFTPLFNLTATETWAFVICAVALIVGMALFNLGADLAMTPMGEQVGTGLPKAGKRRWLLIISF